jgi:hypothetical protein
MLGAILLAGLTLFVGLTQTGSGDSTRVVGRVTGGPHASPVPKVWVVATSASQVVQTQTDERGQYAFLTLLPGVYRLTAYPEWNGAMYEVETLVASGRAVGACASAEPALVELSAGVEYLANLELETPCRR